jgi:mercuric ion transport protein
VTDAISKAGLLGSIVATVTAACCILPMALLLVGLGGSWIAVFGAIAAASLHVVVVAAVIIVTAWILAIRRKVSTRTYATLGTGTALTIVAWVLVLNEAAINDYLITLM